MTQAALMAFMPSVNAAYCMWQSSETPQNFTLSKQVYQYFDGDGSVYVFMGSLFRSTARMDIFIPTQLFPLMVYLSYASSEFWSLTVPEGKRALLCRGALRRLSTRIRGKLLYPSFLALAFCLPIALSAIFVVFVALHFLLNMVHHGDRKRPREHHDDGSRPTTSSADNPAHFHANLPPPQANVKPSSPARRPTPNSAFQATHFKFRSNLNRPLISGHITIILSEEENQILPLACIVPEPSQCNKQHLTMGSPEKVLGDQPGNNDSPRISMPQVGNLTSEGDGTLKVSEHPISPPKDDKTGNEVLRLVGDSLDEETTPGRDVEA